MLDCGPTTFSSTTIGDLPTCMDCDQSTYNFGNGMECMPCPQSLFKYEGCTVLNPLDNLDLQIKSGFWPDTFTAPTSILSCPFVGACNAINCTTNSQDQSWIVNCNYCGNSTFESPDQCDQLCNEGYQGRLCSQCVCSSFQNCYYQSEGSCFICFEEDILSISTLVEVVNGIIAFIVFAIIAFLLPKTTLFWILIGLIIFSIFSFLGVFTWYYSGFLFVILLLYFIADRKLPAGVLKCLFFYLQIITSIMNINSWPVILQNLVRTFELTNLNISFLSCFWPSAFSNPLILYLLFNLIVPIVAILTCSTVFLELIVQQSHKIKQLRANYDIFINKLLGKIRRRISKSSSKKIISYDSDPEFNVNMSDNSDSESSPSLSLINNNNNNNNDTDNDNNELFSNQSKRNLIAKFVPKMYRIVLLLIGASYFPIAIMTFSVLQCSNGYMKEYLWIPCNSFDFYVFLIVGAIVMTYIIAYPLLLLINLFALRKKFLSGIDVEKFQSVLEGYKKKRFYYEVIYITEKLMLAFALTIFSENGFTQVLLVTLSIVMGMFAQYLLRPYQSGKLNTVVFFSRCVIIVSYIYNILAFFTTDQDYQSFLFALSWLCAFFNGFVLVLFLYLIIEPKLALRKPKDVHKIYVNNNDL